MADQLVPFGVLLRRWRVSRRMTQIDLAQAAGSSARHLSYLETGRSRPSREIVLRFCEHLDVPLRDRNALLLAAGLPGTVAGGIGIGACGDRAGAAGAHAISGFRGRPALECRAVERRTAATLRGLLRKSLANADQCHG